MPQPAPIAVVFFGTPEYAVPTLERLHTDSRFDVRAVVTQPDRPAGRKHQVVAPPVAELARSLGYDVLQPDTLRDEAARQQLRDCDADLFIVAAFGKIFSRAILDIPRLGCLNLHASLLPDYRGAAPITAAILSGDKKTGVTLMQMERGLDTGAMIGTIETAISETDTTLSLTERLGALAADLTERDVPRYLARELRPVPQPAGASIVRQLAKADGAIDWTQSADAIERHVRAMWSWPRAWTRSGDIVVQLHRASVSDVVSLAPGEVGRVGNTLAIGTGSSALIVDIAQLPGGKPMSGSALLNNPTIQAIGVFEPAEPPEVPFIRPAD